MKICVYIFAPDFKAGCVFITYAYIVMINQITTVTINCNKTVIVILSHVFSIIKMVTLCSSFDGHSMISNMDMIINFKLKNNFNYTYP